tara:strand:- start:300 stop:575 length:276 start_codon:yes stop_codon:yes gene_type:complete
VVINLLDEIKKIRNDMVARNYPFQQLSNLIIKYEEEMDTVKEDRGPLDLTLLIEEKDKSITDLKKDNKLLADQVYELKKENADLKNKLDNR